MSRRPWWVPGDWPRAAWSLLPIAVMWGIITSQAISRGHVWAIVVLTALAIVGVLLVVAAAVYHRRHPEVRDAGPPPPLTRLSRVRLAVAVCFSLILAVAGLVVLVTGGGPTGVVLVVVGLVTAIVCGSTLGESDRR